MEWLYLVIGMLIGGLGAWLLGRAQARDAIQIVRQQIEQKDAEIIKLRELYDNERAAHARLQARQDVTAERLAAQEKFIEESKEQLSNAFSALSSRALSGNTTEFLKLAKAQLGALMSEAKGDLGKRQEAIDRLIKPLNETLARYQKQTQTLETSLKQDYGSLEQHLRSVKATTDALSRETANLGQALRTPQVRGKWGELTLRNVAELAGMSEHCDFVEQESVDTEDGKQRPDMIVHLPGEGRIVVDAKVPLVAFLDAVEASSEEDRKRHLERHCGHVKTHMKQLGSKAYWHQFENAPDFVVMFIPGESFFSAAVDVDHDLIEEGMRSNVILASPTTFVALLRTVAMGWRQEQIARNAAEISRLGAEIHERIIRFIEHFAKVGKSLEQATAAYNSSVGTLESRVLVSARKFKELGATAQEEIPEVPRIDRAPRAVQADLLAPSDDEDGR